MSKVCKIEKCGRPVRAKGYCGSHYNQELYDSLFDLQQLL